MDRGDRAAQVDIIERLVELAAPMGGQWDQLAILAANNGEIALARRAADRLVEDAGGGPAAQYRKAVVLAGIGAWGDADALLRSLPEDVPGLAANAYSRGIGALNLGRPEEAKPYLERVTELRPQAGSAWLALATSADLAREPALADRLIAAERAMEGAAPAEVIPYCYALGTAHAARGEHDRAFAAFARGAALMKATLAYDLDADRASAAQAIDGYTAERITRIAGLQREPTARTIFVGGLPRSGTTLVERILTSHSALAGGGETGRLSLLVAEIGGASHAALERHVEAHGVEGVTRLWHHWLAQLFAAPGRVVDKSVDTSRYLGLAAALLPEAPLVWLTRDPLDRAWSCSRTNFLGNAVPWSYDLEDIAAHFRVEDELLARWQEILGARLLVVPYEALVGEPEAWIRRILAHCGLGEEPAPFAPHESRRPVATASLVQVRRPINREGIGAAEPYRRFLQPFIDAYYGGTR